MKLIILSIVLSALAFGSCNNRRNSVIAEVDGKEICSSEIDRTIELQIYQKLYELYDIRKTATDAYLTQAVIDIESKKCGVSRTDLLNDNVYSRITDAEVEGYITINNITSVPIISGYELKYVNCYSAEGLAKIKSELYDKLLNNYTDSLKSVYHANVLLQEPIHPKIKQDSLIMHYRNFDNKKPLIITELSDFNCNVCRSFHHTLDSLCGVYQDEVSLCYSNLCYEPNIASRAAVAAANQDSFWSMYDLLMNSKNIVDSVSAVNFAIELNLDLNQFLFDISNPQTDSLIADNNLRMMRRGLYATPTILLNGRLVPNAASNGVLEREIKRALSEVGDR